MFAKSSGKLFKNRWEVYPYPIMIIALIIGILPVFPGTYNLTLFYAISLAVVWILIFLFGLLFVYVGNEKLLGVVILRRKRGAPVWDIKLAHSSILICPFQKILAVIDLDQRVLINKYVLDLPGRKLHLRIAVDYAINSDHGSIGEVVNRQLKAGFNIDKELEEAIQDYLPDRKSVIAEIFGSQGTEAELEVEWKKLGVDLKNRLETTDNSKLITIGEVGFLKPAMIMETGKP